MVVVAGETFTEAVFPPVLQTYDTAPDAVNVEVCDGQTVAGLAVAVTEAAENTVTLVVSVKLHGVTPDVVMLQVYVVVTLGLTVIAWVVAPVDQL